MSAIGTKRTSLFALQMSAYDPKLTLASLNDPHLNRYDDPVLSPGEGNETTRVHHASRRCGGSVAARSARAAARRAHTAHRRTLGLS